MYNKKSQTSTYYNQNLEIESQSNLYNLCFCESTKCASLNSWELDQITKLDNMKTLSTRTVKHH